MIGDQVNVLAFVGGHVERSGVVTELSPKACQARICGKWYALSRVESQAFEMVRRVAMSQVPAEATADSREVQVLRRLD